MKTNKTNPKSSIEKEHSSFPSPLERVTEGRERSVDIEGLYTYQEAVEELEKILASLEENDDVNMDDITEKVKRASELMVFCKKKLHHLDEELEKIISGSLDNI